MAKLLSLFENLSRAKFLFLMLLDYIFIIKTSDRSIPIGDLSVQFQFVCSKGQSIILNLVSPYVTLFETFQLDSFLVNSSIDLGKPEKLR